MNYKTFKKKVFDNIKNHLPEEYQINRKHCDKYGHVD